MTTVPKKIRLNEIADVISDRFSDREAITCYLGSNAATPTASIESLTRAIEARAPRLPFIRMVHLLTQGPVPYVAEGLQDRIMTYSIFSGGSVREAANEGRAFYLLSESLQEWNSGSLEYWVNFVPIFQHSIKWPHEVICLSTHP